jgi:hypothetical protein
MSPRAQIALHLRCILRKFLHHQPIAFHLAGLRRAVNLHIHFPGEGRRLNV